MQQDNLLLFKALWAVTPILVSIVGWFIVRNVGRIERDIDGLNRHVEKLYGRIAVVSSELQKLKGEHIATHAQFRRD